jgi:hypothetical protein
MRTLKSSGFFSRAAAGREKLVGAINALPRMKTEPKQDGPLKEVFTGKPDGVNRVTSFANHLSRHAFPLERDIPSPPEEGCPPSYDDLSESIQYRNGTLFIPNRIWATAQTWEYGRVLKHFVFTKPQRKTGARLCPKTELFESDVKGRSGRFRVACSPAL